MSEENKELVRRLMAAADERAEATIDALVADDFLAHISGMPDANKAAWRQNVSMFYDAFSDLRHPPEEMIADGDKVAVRTTFTGRHTGEFLGVLPSGNSVEFQAFFMMRIADGKCAEEWGCMDVAGLMRQIGAGG